jgi:hemolysin activation/secretion protein
MKSSSSKHMPVIRLLLLVGAASQLCAQVAPPDAGDVLRSAKAKPVLAPPITSRGVLLAGKEDRDEPFRAGPSVEVRDVVMVGNTVFSAEELKAVIADQIGQTLDLAGMKTLARRISSHYRERGYPFARAMVLVQQFSNHTLTLTILEGRYASIDVNGGPDLVAGAKPYLAALQPGDLLEADKLERTMLLLDDIPGIAVTPTIGPGLLVGTSRLEVSLTAHAPQGGDVGVDNAGSRYTGYHRGHVSWYYNGLATFGDRATAMVMATDLHMLFGSLDYERPLNGQGLRWQFGYSRTAYDLGEEYAALDATGVANVWSTRLSYPLLRTQTTNLNLTVGLQYKGLRDDFRSVGVHEWKETISLPLSLRFDHRDHLFAGALTYGLLSCSFGHLHLDGAMQATDAVTARKAGEYRKVNFDLARIQAFTREFSVYARISVQWANDNLDSSERLGTGGAEGVRAYPLGEGSGDVGWIGQVEARYALGDFIPYLFYDAARTRLNYQPWDAPSDQVRNLSGVGLGVRYEHEAWSGNLAIAWRIDGGAPTQDIGPTRCRVAFALSRTF